MRVKLKTRYAGPAGNFGPGDVIDLDQAIAGALIMGGFAEAVAELKAVTPEEVEVAEVPPPAKRRPRRKRRGSRR